MVDVLHVKTIRSRSILSKKDIEHIVYTVLKKERSAAKVVSVHIVGEARMKSLNTMYRGVAAPTDVLSFESGESWGVGEEELGDIFLCQTYIIAQAKRFKVSAKEEMTRMLVHGVLHLLGYDHEKKSEAAVMFDLQERYVVDSMSK